jgi:hypothetical protein
MYLICKECHDRAGGKEDLTLPEHEQFAVYLAKVFADGYYTNASTGKEAEAYTQRLDRWFDWHKWHGGNHVSDHPYYIGYETPSVHC